MRLNLFRKQRLFRTLALLALLILLLPSMPRAGAPKPAPPAPPDPPAPPAAPIEELLPPQGWLGIVLSDEGAEEGATVTGVKPDSPAEKAGLKEGDRILDLDGRKVRRARDVRSAMRDLEPGDTVQIRIQRKSQEKTLTATVGKPPERALLGLGPRWHSGAEPEFMEQFDMLRAGRNYLGVRVLSMTEDLRAYFKAPRGRGLLVSRVEEDTPAGKAGLRAGDVIIAVDGKGISDRSDIAQALSDHEAGDRVPVKIIRDGAEKNLDVEIAERHAPRRHGAFFFPGDHDFDLDMDLDPDDEGDLEHLEVIPEETGEMIRESVRMAGEEVRRAMREIPQYRAQVAAALGEVRISDEQMKEIHRQIEKAMQQARETIREVTEAIREETI